MNTQTKIATGAAMIITGWEVILGATLVGILSAPVWGSVWFLWAMIAHGDRTPPKVPEYRVGARGGVYRMAGSLRKGQYKVYVNEADVDPLFIQR